MFEDIRLEDIAQLVEACDTASRQNKKRFVFRENVYTVSRCESFLSETFESLDLKSEDAGASISKKMMQISELRNWALEVAQIDIITHEELCEMVSPELQNVVTALFLDEASEEGKIRIIKTKDNKFQVQRMTKGDFVDQGKPYKSLKQAEKERSTGQSSMQFESEISWDFDGVMVHITRNNFDNLDEDMKNNTVNAETVSVDGVHMPVLFVAETRQMKDAKNEIMVQLKGKVKVIDKKDEKKYLAMGYTLAECMELQIEAASPEKIMKDIAALEKMLTKFGGNSSAVKMKKVALERKIAKLEKELENMEEDATVAAFLDMLNEYGYGKKKMKDEELSPKQKKIDKNKNGKIDGSDLQSLRKEGADDYEDHMMYDPKTGKGRMTKSYEDHLDLKDKGWGHEKSTKESVNPYESLYGKPVDEAMSPKEKAKARALAKADKDAQPKDKVSLKKAPWDKKMKEDFVKQMNIIVEGGELEQSIEESMSPKQIDMLKKSYESLRGKKISVENGMKLSKTLEKLDKESAIAVAKADIPFMSNLAMNKLIMNFGMSGADIKKAMKESVEDDIQEDRVPWNDGSGEHYVSYLDRGHAAINMQLKLGPKGKYKNAQKRIDDHKSGKKTDKNIAKMIKDLGESVGGMEKAAAELEAYAKKNGGMDKNTFMRVANLLKTGHPDKLKSYVNNMDTDPREYVAMLLKKHIGKKSTEKMMDIKFRGESISWEDAETLRAAGVKLDEISSDMKKRYNKSALKDRDQQKNTLKRADDVGSKVVDGAVTDKASPSQTNSRFAKLDKIKQKANRKLTNRREGLATPGKGSSTNVKDYFGMAETKKPVSQMTDKEKTDNAAKRKEYKAYQKSKRNEEVSGTGYELYHKTLGSAIDTAITHAKLKFGIDITPDERMEVVGMGPRKPSNGKTNTYRLMGNKGKAIQVQVYNRGGSRPYELNMYKE